MTTNETVNVRWAGLGHEPWEFKIQVQQTGDAPVCADCYVHGATMAFFGTMFGEPIQHYRRHNPSVIWWN